MRPRRTKYFPLIDSIIDVPDFLHVRFAGRFGTIDEQSHSHGALDSAVWQWLLYSSFRVMAGVRIKEVVKH